MKKSKEKIVDLNISPSRAYLATLCMQWQKIKSGTKLLPRPKNAQSGIEKHAEIENDLNVVKSYLPKGYEKFEVKQEYPVKTEIIHKGFRLVVEGIEDCQIYDKTKKKLWLFDWKTGGSQVDDISEEQLVLYALCAIREQDVKELELIYVNPDLGSSYTKNFKPFEIVEKVYAIIEKIALQKERGYNVGEHCQYCPAKSACPELLTQLKQLISPEVNGKEIQNFTELQLDVLKVGEKVIEELKGRLRAYLTLNPDKNLHGYILSDRKGVRVIRQDAEINILAERLGVKTDSLFEKKLFTPKQLEDRGFEIEKISDFIFQPVQKVLKKI